MTLASRVRAAYWPARYAMWSPRKRPARAGYAVLVPVPADLPMLTDISLSVIGRQHDEGRLQTIVVPDRRSDAVARLVERHRSSWSGGSLRLLDLKAPEQALLPRLNDPGKNHAAQLLRGIDATDASHVIFHDADLVPLDEQLHHRLWQGAAAPGRAVAGLDPPWDPWFADRDRHLVATWEMCAEVDWLRSFRPWRHFAHEAEVPGGRHVFDTTFWAQWRTPQSRLGLLDAGADFVHFNYVISTYRHYQSWPRPFHDEDFRLLLLRLLVDLFGEQGGNEDLPTIAALVAGLGGSGEIRYDVENAPEYLRMRDKLVRLVDGAWSGHAGPVRAALEDFDDWAARAGDGV